LDINPPIIIDHDLPPIY